MKKLSSKILLIVMAVTLILSLNATVNATAEDMAVLENANGDYLIYLNGHLNDEYSYAITTSADVEENNLNWYTAEDTKGNKVIKVSKDQVGSYLWVKIDDEIIKKAEPINISEVSTEAEINEMKTLTTRIKVDATQTITEETREENVIRTVTQGTLKITDDANAKYSYDVLLLNGENANCQELVNVMNKINSDMDIFESIKLSQEYTNLWNNIGNNSIIGIINIPKIDLEYPILDITTKENMRTSITRFSGGNVNEIGNLALAGHNNYDGTMFGKNDELVVGDKIYLTDLQKNTVEYEINSIFVTDPNDVSILETNEEEIREVTLITCENGNKARLIIKAEEVKK